MIENMIVIKIFFINLYKKNINNKKIIIIIFDK
jgi:hypothetical protein